MHVFSYAIDWHWLNPVNSKNILHLLRHFYIIIRHPKLPIYSSSYHLRNSVPISEILYTTNVGDLKLFIISVLAHFRTLNTPLIAEILLRFRLTSAVHEFSKTLAVGRAMTHVSHG